MALPNLNGPLQLEMADVPVFRHDVRGGILGFGATIRTLQNRDRRMAIFEVGGVPVLPYLNAQTGISSGHIIQVFDSAPPAYHVHKYEVDLYICDENGYLGAFRRRRTTLQGDVQEGRWFCFDGMVDTEFLHATPIAMGSHHVDGEPGGEEVLAKMLYSLAYFEAENGEAGPLTIRVKAALWDAMVYYCEARRIRAILVEVLYRIQYNLAAAPLSEVHWKLIHGWSSFCTEVLKRWFRGQLTLTSPLTPHIAQYNPLPTLGSLIGIYGELLSIKLDWHELGLTAKEFDAHWKLPGAANVPEPGVEQKF